MFFYRHRMTDGTPVPSIGGAYRMFSDVNVFFAAIDGLTI